MVTTVQKWGNSLAVRIPRTLAADSRLTEGKPVTLTLCEGNIVIARERHPRYSLRQLIQGVTPQNRHTEIGTGDAVGREVW